MKTTIFTRTAHFRASATTSLALAQVFRRRHRRDTGSGDDDAAVRVYGRGPGPTQDVLGSSSGSDVISISGAETHKDSGKLLLVTVNAAGVPGYPVTNAQALAAWLDPKQTVMPQEVVFPVGQTSEEYAEESSQEMDSSQSSATNAALSYLKGKGMDVSGVKVSMHVDDIGGPSAGMMYALGVIDKLTEADETGGKTIAGTGTIDAKGKVGAIGGIRLKMLGAA